MEKSTAVFKKLGSVLSSQAECSSFANFCFKAKQIQCFEYILGGHDVIAVLPTGYGKSLIFHLLPWILPQKQPNQSNIVLVVCPLSSIIRDQVSLLSEKGIRAEMLPNSLIDKPDDVSLSLFPKTENGKTESKGQGLLHLSDIVKSGELDILFGHPEAFLSAEGRQLLKSDIFKERVVACAIDEAHCVEIWGKEFRTDFSELAVLRSLIPELKFIAVTATATKKQTKTFAQTLCMKNLKVVCVSPNRPNIFLSIVERKPSLYGFDGVTEILEPIAKNLLHLKENFPMTIIYMRLDFCGKAYKLFDRILTEKQYVGKEISCKARLFNQFHSPSPPAEKVFILEEIKQQHSRIRVLFATTALGMGVDAPNIAHVMHIGPPSSMEAYTQEIGRAGRTKCDSWATLFYNNNDIAPNTHTQKSMRDYCLAKGCLRKELTNYFDFQCPKQKRCCSNCDENNSFPYFSILENRKRQLGQSMMDILKQELDDCLKKYEDKIKNDFYFDIPLPEEPGVASKSERIAESVADIVDEMSLLYNFDVFHSDCRKELFSIIDKYAPIAT